MTLFEIYEAAKESAEQNENAFNAEYIEQYADGALDVILGEGQLKAIWDAHEKMEAYEGVNTQDNYYHCIESVLSEISA